MWQFKDNKINYHHLCTKSHVFILTRTTSWVFNNIQYIIYNLYNTHLFKWLKTRIEYIITTVKYYNITCTEYIYFYGFLIICLRNNNFLKLIKSILTRRLYKRLLVFLNYTYLHKWKWSYQIYLFELTTSTRQLFSKPIRLKL